MGRLPRDQKGVHLYNEFTCNYHHQLNVHINYMHHVSNQMESDRVTDRQAIILCYGSDAAKAYESGQSSVRPRSPTSTSAFTDVQQSA